MQRFINFIIPLPPVTKKNSMQIITINGRPRIIPSKKYIQYEKDCAKYMPQELIGTREVNVKALYYMPTRRRVDLTNLNEALHDILVKYRVLDDDNSNIIVSTDGSRVLYDKEFPRTVVEIEVLDYD